MDQYRRHLVTMLDPSKPRMSPRSIQRCLRFHPLVLAMVVCQLVSAQAAVPLFSNEVIVQNATSWAVTVTVVPKHPSMEGQGSTFVLEPGGSTVIGRYGDPEGFVSPVQRMTVTGTVRNRNGKQKPIGVLMMDKRQVDPQHRTWYYHVMGNGGSVGFSF